MANKVTLFVLFLLLKLTFAQPNIVLIKPESVCNNTPFSITNNSTNTAFSYWDICLENLKNSPTLSVASSHSGTTAATQGGSMLNSEAMTMVKDGGNYFSFITSRSTNKLIRLSFGTSPNNAPTYSDLGNPTFATVALNNRAYSIQSVIDQGKRYLFVSNFTDRTLRFVSFTSDYASSPNNTKTLYTFDQVASSLQFFKIGNTWWATACGASARFYSLRFTNGIESTPDVFTYTLSGINAGYHHGSFLKNGQYMAYVINSGSNNVGRVHFANGLDNQPTYASIGTFTGISTAHSGQLISEGSNHYFLFVNRDDQKIFRLSIPDSLNAPISSLVFSDLTALGMANRTLSMSSIKEGHNGYLFSLSFQTPPLNLYRLKFNQGCSLANDTLVQSNYSNPGINTTANKIELGYSARDASGNSIDSVVQIVNISNPLADFSFPSSCEDVPLLFTNQTIISPLDSSPAYSWDFGDGTGVSSDNSPTYTFSNQGNFDVRLDVVTAKGCVDTKIRTISINPNPVVDFSVLPTCGDDSVSFVNTSSISTGSISVNRWDFGNGQVVVSSASSFKYKYLSPDTYYVKLKCFSLLGCVDSLTKTVIVSGASVSAQNKCVGGSGTLFTCNYIPPAGVTLTSMGWDINGELLSGNNVTYIFGFAGTYTIKTYLEYANGCKDTVVSDVTIGEVPQSDFSATQVCSGVATSFTDETILAIGDISTWAWNFDDPNAPADNTSDLQNPVHTYTAAGDYLVSLVVTTSTGCSASISKTITIYEPENLTILSSNIACTNELLALQTTDPFVTYYWTLPTDGGNLFSTLANPKFFLSDIGTNVISLTVTNVHGCQLSTGKSITVYEAPVADFSYSLSSDGKIYKDSVVSMESLSLGVQTYEWKILPVDQYLTGSLANYTFENSGQYTIRHIVHTADGCIDSIDKTIEVITAPDPILDLELWQVQCQKVGNKLTTSFSVRNSGTKPLSTFEVAAANGLGLPIFESFNVQLLPGQVLDTTLSYQLFVSDNNAIPYNCLEVKSINNQPDTIPSNNKSCCLLSFGLKVNSIFPNPASDRITLDLSSSSKELVVIKFYNEMGQLVKQWPGVSLALMQQNLSLDVSGFPGGLYLITVQQGTTISEHKVLITGTSQN